jgi:hypothetical protein
MVARNRRRIDHAQLAVPQERSMSSRAVFATSAFKISSDQRFSDTELERLIARIEAEPCDGDEIEGLEGLRLLPWPSRSAGELVWHQVAYLYVQPYEFVYLLDVLDCQEVLLPTHRDKLDAIERLGRITELAVRISEIVIRMCGS